MYHQVFSWSDFLKEDGFVLILTLVLMLGILLLGINLSDHLLIQSKIQQNLYCEMKTYYLSEAGLNYAINRLQSNPTWRSDDLMIDFGTDGQIRIQVSEDTNKIIVHSKGIYHKYQREVIRSFIMGNPIIRVLEQKDFLDDL